MSFANTSGPSQAIEQCRLAGIRIAHERHHRFARTLAAGTLHSACAAHIVQLRLEPDDLVVEHPAVGFKLALPRPGQEASTTPLALQVGPGPHKTGALIEQPRKLNLQPAFLGAGPQSEDFKDQPGPVDHLHAELFFEVALLDRRQRAINHDQRAVSRFKVLGKPVQDPAGNQLGRIDLPHMFRPQECQLASQRFNQTGGFLQPVCRRSIGWREPGNDSPGNFRRRKAINKLVAQKALFLVNLFVEELDGSAWRDRGNGMLVHQLRRTTIAPQQHTKVVKPGHYALQLHTIHEKHRQWRTRFAHRIQKGILKVLFFISRHSRLIPVVLVMIAG
jgi:hypothetical protein